MGLSARERRILDAIEDGLAASDPGLASLLGTFAVATAGEPFPARDKTRASRRRCVTGRLHWRTAWPVLWLAVSIAMIAAALVTGHASGTRACVLWPACAWQAPSYAGNRQAGKSRPGHVSPPAGASSLSSSVLVIARNTTAQMARAGQAS